MMDVLAEHRKSMRQTAILRDGGLCMPCWWLHSQRERRGEEVHHVFGRGAQPQSVKEAFTSLMTVCRECHPSPILLPPTQVWQAEILTVWHNMNVSPKGNIRLLDGFVVYNPIGLRHFKVTDTPISYWSI